MSRAWQIALEAEANGQLHKEPEHDFYAILANPQVLYDQRWEQQEQWVIRVDKAPDGSRGLVRVRKTVQGFDGVPVYESAIKNKTDSDEVEATITEDMFKAFRRLSSDGQIKDRYFFPVPGSDRVFEVDCFLTPEAQIARHQGYNVKGTRYHEWVKIDFEVHSKRDPIPEFPFEVSQVIMKPYGSRTPEDEKIVNNLYKKVWVAVHPNVK